MALETAGLRVLWASNHKQLVLDYHKRNHPGTEHICQDLHQADWAAVPDCDLAAASPSCQGHCDARGAERENHERDRATMFAVTSMAERKRPAVIMVENVEEVTRWLLFDLWLCMFQKLGYHITWKVLDAADYGVPQNRVRIFVILTQFKLETDPFSLLRTQPQIPFRTILEDVPLKSRVRDKCANTRRRIAKARLELGDEFLVPYYSSATTGRSLDRPLGTVTTRDRYAYVKGDRLRMLTITEYKKAMTFPLAYQLPSSKAPALEMLGNAVPPVLASQVISAVKECALSA